MPRDGSSIYHTPAGTPGIPNTTIASTPYNGYLADIEQDLNLPRPIVAGGTGANNAVQALTNLSGEITNQTVTNYDSFPFKPGSFYSVPGATSAPVPAHFFSGICYGVTATNLMLEARDQSVGTFDKYVRNFNGTSWSAWQLDGSAQFVAKAGDTMTGDLKISAAGPDLILNKASGTAGTQNNIWGQTNNSVRWLIQLGNETSETGSNLGSDFTIQRYNDAAGFIGNALSIARNTGIATFSANVVSAATSTTGSYYFGNSGTKSLTYDGSNYQLSGGNLNISSGNSINVTNSNINVTGGVFQTAFTSTTGSYYFGNMTGGASRFLTYDGSSFTLGNAGTLFIAAGDLNLSTGNIVISGGYRTRAGYGGSSTGNVFNINWTGSAMEMWRDTTNLGTISISSDYRIKKDVIDLPGMWDAVKNLRPIKYTQAEFRMFKADNVERWGFIAHELQETLLPSASSGVKDAPNEIQSPNPLTVIAALTRALQEAMGRIEALEAKAGR